MKVKKESGKKVPSKDSVRKDKEKIIKLEEECEDLRREIKLDGQDLVKAHAVRNLKIVASALKFLTPFCISGTLLTGIFYFTNAGLPFVKDSEKKYKKYVYTTSKEQVELSESYDGGTGNKYNYGKTDFYLYFPWSVKGDFFERDIRHYDIKELDDIKVYCAIKDVNVDYITLNCEYQSEEKEVANMIKMDEMYDQAYIDGIVTCIDKDDFLLIEESDKNNMSLTICEGILTVLVGVVILKISNFKLKNSVSQSLKEYSDLVKHLNSKKELLSQKENKIKALGKWVQKNEKK